MEKSLFFNAFPDAQSPTGYDRNYNADDISDWFSIVCDIGVLKGGLAVTNGDGMSVNVAIGKATIKGKGYVNNAIVTLDIPEAPVGANPRYDCVVLRMDNTQTGSGRKIYLTIVSSNTKPTEQNVDTILTRTSTIYDLMLAYVQVNPSVTSIQQSDITDTRGNKVMCPYFTAVKGYDDYYDAIIQRFESNGTMASAGRTFVTNLPTKLYNNKYSLIDVYCNGLKEEDTDYSIQTSSGFITITFTAQKSAGASISVVLKNFIDGEGMSTAIQEYNQWVQDVADLKTAEENVYICNGLNDNAEITNIVNEFIDGGTDYSSMNLKIVGNFGCYNGTQYPVPVGGSGTSSNPYRMFDFHSGNRRVTLDFTNCSQVNIGISGVYAWIFAGENITIKGLNLVANGTSSGTSIRVFNGEVTCENCRFWVNGNIAGSLVFIAQKGTFTNCRGSVSNAGGNGYCFLTTGIIRINGGEYLAYTGSSSGKGAVVGQSSTGSVSILYGVSAPTQSRTGYTQTNSLYQTGSGNYINCSDLVSALPLYVTTGYSNIRGTIPLSK